MIKSIRVRGFSLLRDVAVEPGDGLTVMTGESGAGKTLLFDAVGFCLGGRSHRSLLAEGVDSCEVEMVLVLDKAGAKRLGGAWQAGANTLQRRYTSAGRSRITLNGQQVTAADVQPAAESLFEITGQFESRILFNPASHLELLDAFADKMLVDAKSAYHGLYNGWRSLVNRLAVIRESAGQREQEIDFLRFQVTELDKAGVEVGEREEVENALRVAENAEGLITAAASAAALLDGDEDSPGAYDLGAQAETYIKKLVRLLDGAEVAGIDPTELEQQAAGLLVGLRELAGNCREIAETIQLDPGELERLRERLDEVQRLERKYGCPADELPALLAEKQERLDYLLDDTQSPEALEQQVEQTGKQVRDAAGQLTKLRRAAVKHIEKSATEFFNKLEFKHVELKVDLSETEPGPDGADQVEFMISLNPGEPARPLARVASGGEASRLLLGLKAALAGRMHYRVLLLDEIEAGVGGDTAARVADVLESLADGRQVLAITHLPVVAARGHHHLVALKSVSGGRTAVVYEPVAGDGRRHEIARMLGDTGGAEEAALVDKLLAK